MVARRRATAALIEAELMTGLRDDLGTILRAVERGAADEAVEILRHRHQLAVSLEESEAEDDFEVGPELVVDQLDLLREAAELAGMAPLASAAENLSLLVSAGQAEVACSLLANAAAPIREALAEEDNEGN